MSLLLLWNAVGAPAGQAPPPDEPVATMQAGGGGSPGRRYERWEAQRAEQDVVVVAHGTAPPAEPPAVKKPPVRLRPVPDLPLPEVEPAPAPSAPLLPPDIERLVTAPVWDEGDDEEAITLLLEDL